MKIIVRTGPNSFMEVGLLMWLMALPFLLMIAVVKLIARGISALARL
jgi:hypothetical protein